jgi:hypothetical protein
MNDEIEPHDHEILATIRGFLSARREWELATMERVTGWHRGELIDPPAPFEEDLREQERAWAELVTLRGSWCTPAAVTRSDAKAPFGTSPEFNPEGLAIVGLAPEGGDRVVVRTRELAYPEFGPVPSEYEYVLCRVEGRWRIDGRAAVEPGYERIEDLL